MHIVQHSLAAVLFRIICVTARRRFDVSNLITLDVAILSGKSPRREEIN